MKKYFTVSNLIFVLLICLFLYKPSRIWVMRLISFSPPVKEAKVENMVADYSWELSGLNTPTINLKEFEGKVVFINFWATWCPPCVAEMPSVQEFYNQYKENVVFVFVTGDDWQTVNTFYKENNYDLPVYQSASNYPIGLPEVLSIPKTFIIDKKGFIRVDKTGSANWNSERFRKKIDQIIRE